MQSDGQADLEGTKPQDGQQVRIVIENGEYWLSNKGDLAMLGVTVSRLRRRWPEARIGVVTLNPTLLRSYMPDAEPLDFGSGGDWSRSDGSARLSAHLPAHVVGRASSVTSAVKYPARVTAQVLRRQFGKGAEPSHEGKSVEPPQLSTDPSRRFPPRVPRAVQTASLVIALGGGYIADVDPDQTHRTLDTLSQAMELGVPTAMVGQGLGPLQDPLLVARAKSILPNLQVLALREQRYGPPLTRSLGIPEDRVVVTGDDAIEMAFKLRPAELGSSLGVCLRNAPYAPVSADKIDALRRAVQTAAAAASAELVPVAISGYRREDLLATLPLTSGYDHVRRHLSRYSSAPALAAQISQCRVMVTGAYHAAVFALAQGIPVVGLSSSAYYDQKFLGLSSMFGEGIRVIGLEDEDLEQRLTTTIRAAWSESALVRPALLNAAEQQQKASMDAYERIFALLPS